MRISEDKIAKFQKIYEERFGKEITEEKAYQKLEIIVRSMQLIYKPMTKGDLEKVKLRQKEIWKK